MPRIEPIDTFRWQNYHWTLDRPVADHRHLVVEPDHAPTSQVLAATAGLIQGLLGECEKARRPVLGAGSVASFKETPVRSGMVLDTHGAASLSVVTPDERLGGTAPLVLVTAGTTIAQLNGFLKARSLSLKTSVADNGQTIGEGCLQNHVRGVHLLTGPDTSIWLERGPAPILEPAFIAGFARTFRMNADQFDAAQAHLGGLGIVNGLLLEVSPGFSLDIVKRKGMMTHTLVAMLQAGQFEAFAQTLWPAADAAPCFVEVTLNPFAAFDRPALVTLHFKRDRVSPTPCATGHLMTLLARIATGELLPLPKPWAEAAIRMLESEASNAHEVPDGAGPHALDLYHAVFAIPCPQLAKALDIMLQGFAENGGGHLVLTLRFVSDAQGLMTFTRFPETAVVNLDGLPTIQSQRAARDVALALEREAIPFSQHWGQRGVITRNRVAREFGDPADPATPAGRWRAARAALVPDTMQPLFASAALRHWGLVD